MFRSQGSANTPHVGSNHFPFDIASIRDKPTANGKYTAAMANNEFMPASQKQPSSSVHPAKTLISLLDGFDEQTL